MANESTAIAQITSTGALAAGGFGTLDIPKPFSEPIMLLDGIHVAGTSHVVGIEEIAAGLNPGDRLKLVRDAGNRHDDHAVMVMANGLKIGFLLCDVNLIPARLMDAGKLLFAQVVDVTQKGKWFKIGIEVYLDD